MAVRITGLTSGLDTDSIVQELVSAYSYKVQSYEKEKTTLEWTEEAWSDVNKDIYSFYTKQLGTMRYQSSYTDKSTTVSNSAAASVTASASAVSGSQTLEITQLAKSGYLTGENIGSGYSSSTTLGELDSSFTDSTITVRVGTEDDYTDTEISLTSSSTIGDVVTALKSAGLTASFDATNGRFFISASATGAANNFTLIEDAEGTGSALAALGLDYNATDSKASKIDGQDSEILLNGASFTSSSNNYSINGLTISALAETSSPITITTNTDTTGIYNKIKEFFSNYNTLINSMTEKYNADSSKGYEPLTDDEKDEMSDTEIEKWEQKIKDALLRRDSTLSSVMSTFSNSLSKSYYILDGAAATYNSTKGGYVYKGEVVATSQSELDSWADANGAKKYSLSSFGIKTLGYIYAAENEQYAYHIDGDEDDSNTSSNTDKLRAAISDDPETVMAFFAALISDTYTSVSDKMSRTSLSSAYTVYNDKQMDKEISEIDDMIDKWQERLEELEEYWYSKFSAMETALAQLQAEQSSMASLLGS